MLDLVLCHKFRNLRLSYRKWSKSESALFRSESVSLRVDKLYAEAIEAVKILAAFSASSTVSIWIRGGIKSGASLWNHSQSVRVSTRAEMSPSLTWSSMWKKIGRWCESSTSGTVTSKDAHFGGPLCQVHHHCSVLILYSHLHLVLFLWGSTLHNTTVETCGPQRIRLRRHVMILRHKGNFNFTATFNTSEP